jgi:Fe-S-cluster containining protein
VGCILCEHCTALCCKYIALPIDTPRTPRDFDDIRWYLMHENVSVFVEDGDWYVQFAARCRNLAADNLCGVYATRPKICREYKAGECDYGGGEYGYDQLFTSAAEIEQFAADWLKRQRARKSARRRRSPRPGHLVRVAR